MNDRSLIVQSEDWGRIMDESWKTFKSGAAPERLMVRVVDAPGDEAASE